MCDSAAQLRVHDQRSISLTISVYLKHVKADSGPVNSINNKINKTKII